MRKLRKPRVLYIVPAFIPSTAILCKQLSRLQRNREIDLTVTLEKRADKSLVTRSDLIVFARNCEPAYGGLLDLALLHQVPYVYELDDNFWEIPLEDPVGRYHRAPARLAQLELFVEYADLVRVYSPPLFERVRTLNKRVALRSAGVDFDLVPREPRQRSNDRLRIVYPTSRQRDVLYQIFVGDLGRILESFQDRVEVVFLGSAPPEFRGKPGVRVEGFVSDYEKFFRDFSARGYDIGLAPLPGGRFFESKTNNKFREYGASRIAGVYSNVPVYSNCVRDGETGLLVENQPGAWFDALTRLITTPDLRLQIQDQAFADVHQNYRMEVIEEQWRADLSTVLAREKPKIPVIMGGKRRRFFPIRPPANDWCGFSIQLPELEKFLFSQMPIEILTNTRAMIRLGIGKTDRHKELHCRFEPIKNSEDRLFFARIDGPFEDVLSRSELTLLYEKKQGRKRGRRRPSSGLDP